MEPARRSTVPSPSATSDVGRLSIHVARNYIGLDFVALHARPRASTADWVQQSEHLPGLVTIAEGRKGHDCPHGSVGVLAAVFTDAGQVGLNVARIVRRVVKRGR